MSGGPVQSQSRIDLDRAYVVTEGDRYDTIARRIVASGAFPDYRTEEGSLTIAGWLKTFHEEQERLGRPHRIIDIPGFLRVYLRFAHEQATAQTPHSRDREDPRLPSASSNASQSEPPLAIKHRHYTECPGVKPNQPYQVQKGDALYSIIYTYMEKLPDSHSLAWLKKAEPATQIEYVFKLVATENYLRRRETKLRPDQPLSIIHPGQVIDLPRVFTKTNLERAEKELRDEQRGAEADVDETPTVKLPQAFVAKKDAKLTPASKNVADVKPKETVTHTTDVVPDGRKLKRREMWDVMAKELEATKKDGIVIPGLTVSLLVGQGEQESSWVTNRVGSALELGLFQLKPGTAKDLWPTDGLYGHETFSADLRADPNINANLAIRYLAQLYGRFGNLDDALAAYNRGPAAWEAVKQSGDTGSNTYQKGMAYLSIVRSRASDPGNIRLASR